MKSLYKHLVVSGCSFTTNEHVPDKSDWNWPNILARDTGMQIHNLATAGAGNSHIANSIIFYLTQHPELTPENTLVMAMWSGVGRIDLLVGTDLEWSAPNAFYYPKVHSIVGGHWWNLKTPSLGERVIQSYSQLQEDHSFAATSWLEMKKLETYLTANEFTHRFTSFVNYNQNVIIGDALVVPYLQCLQELGLEINRANWLPLKDSDHYGDWCRERNLLVSDGFHPGADGPQRWPREVLVPLLAEQGILQ